MTPPPVVMLLSCKDSSLFSLEVHELAVSGFLLSAQVDELHARFCAELRRIFECYKGEHSPEFAHRRLYFEVLLSKPLTRLLCSPSLASGERVTCPIPDVLSQCSS